MKMPSWCGAAAECTPPPMVSALEAMGLSLLTLFQSRKQQGEKAEMAQAAEAIKVLLEKDIKPKDIMTKRRL